MTTLRGLVAILVSAAALAACGANAAPDAPGAPGAPATAAPAPIQATPAVQQTAFPTRAPSATYDPYGY